MQTATLFAFIVLGLAAMIHAQNCPGRAERPSCSPQPSRGTNRGRDCQRRAGRVWAWNSRTRTSEPLNYLGCGGNANRWCTRQECDRRCDTRRTTRRSTRRTTRRGTRRTTRRTTRRPTRPTPASVTEESEAPAAVTPAAGPAPAEAPAAEE